MLKFYTLQTSITTRPSLNDELEYFENYKRLPLLKSHGIIRREQFHAGSPSYWSLLYFCKRSCGKPLRFLFSDVAFIYGWVCSFDARIFINKSVKGPGICCFEMRNWTVVVHSVLKKRMQMLLDGQFRRLRKAGSRPGRAFFWKKQTSQEEITAGCTVPAPASFGSDTDVFETEAMESLWLGRQNHILCFGGRFHGPIPLIR